MMKDRINWFIITMFYVSHNLKNIVVCGIFLLLQNDFPFQNSVSGKKRGIWL